MIPKIPFKKGKEKSMYNPDVIKQRLGILNPAKRPEIRLKISNALKDNKNPRWKGGTSWYHHQKARKIMEGQLGRKLTSKEVVHHIDGNWKNHSWQNLQLLPNKGEHNKIHKRFKRLE